MAPPVIVEPVVTQDGPGGYLVSARVDGHPVWFATRDAELDASPEAVAGTVLLPAATQGRRVESVAPVSAIWRANIRQMMETWREWWAYPELAPRAPELPAPRPRRSGATLCFTGGVDSFHSLLCGPTRPDVLAFVHGYDIPLEDSRRMAAWEPALREIAGATGARAVVIRTNLRQHPLVAASCWEQSHGGALAAVGHLLAPLAGTLLIASSFPPEYGYQWGSHLRLDPLWSSDRLQVIHDGAAHSRVGKLQAIAGHDLAQRHLRVCWENLAATGNCSRCDKCLCTMTTVEVCGQQQHFRSFNWPASLADQIERLPATRFRRTFQELLGMGLESRLAGAIQALLRRSSGRAPVVDSRRQWRDWLRLGGVSSPGRAAGAEGG